MNKIVGIAAEYNPFHKGHLYQVEEIRKTCADAGIIAVLSSCFLQRGVPALLDKWERARAAVLCGVDLVIEHPLPFCCNNAGIFASGAVALMKATGITDAISFGMENKTELLRIIPDILVQEPPAFKVFLQEFLKKGLSYAESRARAVEKLCPGGGELLSRPNNTLAFAYAEAARRQGADFELLPVLRKGAGYHELAEAPLMSAEGIRESLRAGRGEKAFSSMPPKSAGILRENLNNDRAFLKPEPLWAALRLLLTRADAEELARCAGMSEGMENRFLEIYPRCGSFEELAEAASTRRYPKTRVQRQLMALLLNISQNDARTFQSRGPAYIRPLAMNSRGLQMLRRMRKTASLPVITKPAALRGLDYAQKILALEFRGAAIWESLLPRPNFRRELTAAPQIVDI